MTETEKEINCYREKCADHIHDWIVKNCPEISVTNMDYLISSVTVEGHVLAMSVLNKKEKENK